MPKAAFSSYWVLSGSSHPHPMPAAWTTLKSQPYWYSEERGRESGSDEDVERRIRRYPKPTGEEAAVGADRACMQETLWLVPREQSIALDGQEVSNGKTQGYGSLCLCFKRLEGGDIEGLQAPS